MNSYFKYFVIFLFISCNSQNKIQEDFKTRVLKINTLSESQNINSSYYNALDDSIRVIKYDLSNSHIDEVNKNEINLLADSISRIIYIQRLYGCLINNKFFLNGFEQTGVETIKWRGFRTLFLPYYTIEIIDKNKCIITTKYSKIDPFSNPYGTVFVEDFIDNWNNQYYIKPKVDNVNYKYIGDNEFLISNRFTLKISNTQNCNVELFLKKNQILKKKNKKAAFPIK
jgi:hypothetical protein